MFKQLFRPKTEVDAANGVHSASSPSSSSSSSRDSVELGKTEPESASHRHWDYATPVKEHADERAGSRKPPAKANPTGENPAPARSLLESFEEIYRNAPVKPPKVAYPSLGILRVIDMVHSPHLDGMSADAKRSAVLMALETVGVKAEDLLQDAMLRQRALNDYEESQQTKLRELETVKMKENSLIRAELDRLSAAHLDRIQLNLDELARLQDNLRMWTERKEQESQQIAEAATYCAPQTSTGAGSLTATVTRFGADAVVGKSVEAGAGKR
jgi:hypothetical protein